MRNLFRAVGGPEGRGKRGGKKEVFGEIGAELPRADVPQPHASEMLHGLGPELLEILAGIDGAIAKDVELGVRQAKFRWENMLQARVSLLPFVDSTSAGREEAGDLRGCCSFAVARLVFLHGLGC